MMGIPPNILNFFILLIASVAYYNYPSIDRNLRAQDVPEVFLHHEYDFVIVGAGSAGCVLANRLSEISNWTILLLEVGGEETVVSDTPLLGVTLLNSSLNWNYTTTRQPRACFAHGGICPYPRGRAIGGSSTINSMVYARGNRRDYDRWEALGNRNWSYNDVLPYFKLSEDAANKEFAEDTDYHGTDGPLTVSTPNYQTPLLRAYLDAGVELGFPINDYNARNQTGFSVLQGTLRNGSRCSTGKAYLRPARNRPNLQVAEGALVTRINFDGERAESVTYIRGNRQYNVSARMEIILSAGAINTPQLLMLSGVGPAEQLRKFGIPIVHELQVGQNLQDHFGAPLLYKVTPPVAIYNEQYENIRAIIQYSQPRGEGPLTVPIGLEALAWLNSTYTNRSVDYPDIEIHFSSYYPDLESNVSLWYGLGLILHPASKGNVTLQSIDPYDMPLINTNYMAEPPDMEVAIQAVQYVSAVANTSALQQYHSELATEYLSDCTNYTLYTYEFYKCIVETYTTTIFHPSGTCKMGPSEDKTAVVNPRLRIHGMRNIRVIDTSIMPFVTGGNTNAPTIMIAERGADFIKCYYHQRPQIPNACEVDGYE